MKIRLASELTRDSVVDGPGLRTVLWCQGCGHACPECHNPATHDMAAGRDFDTAALIEELLAIEWQSGVTFSGGEPMLQAKACSQIAQALKAHNINVWCYSGFTFEELLAQPACREFLQYIDVLVDGRFLPAQKSYDLAFRGSANQRIIDVPASLQQQTVVLQAGFDQNAAV